MAEIVITADDLAELAQAFGVALTRAALEDKPLDALCEEVVGPVLSRVVDRHTAESAALRRQLEIESTAYYLLRDERDGLAAQVAAVRDLASRRHTLSAEMLLNTLDQAT